jgi:hypothetical protein
MAWAPDYTTADDLREFITSSTVELDADEANFPRAIAAASRAIDLHCRRQFGLVAAPAARRYQVRRRGRYLAATIDDLMTTTGLLVAGEAVADPELTPLNAAADGKPWTRLEVDSSAVDDRGRVEVTARWGWTTVPVAVVEACLLQASRLSARRGSPFGVAGSPDTGGGEIRLLARVDPDVQVTLEPFRRKARPR